jgi:hypothetical protein
MIDDEFIGITIDVAELAGIVAGGILYGMYASRVHESL